jgi:hypothetical protein
VTHDLLEQAVVAGASVRTVDADDLPPDALVLARIRADGSWSVSGSGTPSAGDRVIVVDGGVSPTSVPGEHEADEHDTGEHDADQAAADG